MARPKGALLAVGLLAACAARGTPPPPPPPPPRPPTAPMPAPSASPAPAASATAPSSATSGCEGSALDLLAAIANPSCRISEEEADRLRDVLEDPKQAPLRVDAALLPDGRIEVRIVNTAPSPRALPLLTHSELDPFPTLANGRTLAAPAPDWPPNMRYDVGRMLTKIVLAPGGSARATLRIDPSVISHSPGHCPPNAKCPPETEQRGTLKPGRYRLRIRTPLYAVREDLAAELDWTLAR